MIAGNDNGRSASTWLIHAAAFCLLLPVCRLGAARTEDTLVLQVRGLESDVEALRRIRDEHAAALSPPHARNRADGAIDISIKAACSGSDLRVQVVRRGGRWIGGRATSQGYSPMLYDADASRLVLEPNRLHGTLTVNVVLYDRSGTNPERGRPQPAIYTITAKLDGDRITGRAELRDPHDLPFARDPGPLIGRWVSAGRPAFKDKKSFSEGSVLDEAVLKVNRAHAIYEQIRAFRLQRETGLPYALAIEQVARHRVVYDRPADASSQKKKARKARQKGKRRRRGPAQAIPDVGELMDAEGVGATDMDARARDDRREQATIEAIKAMRAHVDELAVLAKGAAAAGASTETIQRGDARTPDPDFGPWTGCRPLPTLGGMVQRLPDDVGEDGKPEWPFVSTWRVIGPFPQTLWPSQTTVLPDIVPDYKSRLVVERDRLRGCDIYGKYHGNGTSEWMQVECESERGRLFPPKWQIVKVYPGNGKDWAGLYAVSEIESPREHTLWAAIQMTHYGSVWVNDRLIWQSGYAGLANDWNTYRFQLPLERGRNRIMVRCDNWDDSHHFAFRICTRGRPRAAEAVARDKASIERIRADMPGILDGTIGFRYDHSGRYPDARPVLAWDVERGINVRWRTPLEVNNGGVIVVDGRVFTMEERFTLVCLDAETGRELWRRALDPLELQAPEAHTEAQRLWKELTPQKGAEREKTLDSLNELYRKHAGFGVSKFGRYGGRAMGTPVSDGRCVWAQVDGSVIACYDLDGNRRWARLTGAVGGGTGTGISSPLLVGNKLIMQVAKYVKDTGGAGAEQIDDVEDPPEDAADDDAIACATSGYQDRRPGRRFVLKAWDAATGAPLWETPRYTVPHFGNRYDADGIATPHPMRLPLAGGKGPAGKPWLDVVFTSGGRVFRVSDGQCVNPHIGVNNKCASPVGDGRGTLILYGAERGSVLSSARLMALDAGTVAAEIRWSRRGSAGYGGFVCVDGLCYTYTCKRLGRLRRIGLSDGMLRPDYRHLFPMLGQRNYPPVAFAGGCLFVGESGLGKYDEYWRKRDEELPPERRGLNFMNSGIGVVRPDPEPLVLARNACRGYLMSPAFFGDRMYVRAPRQLICIGPTGAEGERYEAETVARTVLDQLQLSPPTDSAPLKGEPLKGLPYRYELHPLLPGRTLSEWRYIGPLSAPEAKAVTAKLGFPGAWNLAAAGRFTSVEVPTADGVTSNVVQCFEGESEIPPRCTTDSHRFGLALDLLRTHGNRGATVGLWQTILSNDRERVLRLDLDSPYAELWIGGCLVKHNQRIRLGIGNYIVAMRTRTPDALPDTLSIRPRLRPSNDVDAERARRLARLRQAAPYLDRAVKVVPERPVARTCRALLSEMRPE